MNQYITGQEADDRTRIVRITRMHTDAHGFRIRENPSNPCHPCSVLRAVPDTFDKIL